jgi:1-acyl-sn-glycerol-3-phosphate acyltransferase
MTAITGDGRLFALRAWAALIVCAPIAWLAMVLLPSADARWAGMRLACRLVFRLAGIPITLHGGEQLTGASPASIVVSNHTSFLDVVILGALLPCRVRYVAKRELARSWKTRWPLAGIGTLFVERFERRRALADYRRIIAAAADGPPLLFFAEGTLRAEPGLLPFQPGAFLAAAERRLPIVPVVISGLRAVLPGDSRRPRPGAASITILAPVGVEDGHIDDGSRRRAPVAAALRETVRARILAVSGEPDSGEPDIGNGARPD